MKKLQNIVIGFKNCEIITVPANYLVKLKLKAEAFTHEIWHGFDERCSECEFSLTFKNDAKFLKSNFSEIEMQHRIQSNDIVVIELHYDNSDIIQYLAVWADLNDMNVWANRYQKNVIKENYFGIKIKKNFVD